MKRLFTMLAILMMAFSVGNLRAQTKKDGTADERYKANKVQQETIKHQKKDGPADKNFKET